MIYYVFYNAGLLELSPPRSQDESLLKAQSLSRFLLHPLQLITNILDCWPIDFVAVRAPSTWMTVVRS